MLKDTSDGLDRGRGGKNEREGEDVNEECRKARERERGGEREGEGERERGDIVRVWRDTRRVSHRQWGFYMPTEAGSLNY